MNNRTAEIPKTDKQYDKVFIRDLRVRCIIGVDETERSKKQNVFINITMYVDLNAACKSDNVEDTVDYAAITEKVIAKIERSSYFLIERIAEETCNICLKNSKVNKVIVRVEKEGVLSSVRRVGVEISRDRKT